MPENESDQPIYADGRRMGDGLRQEIGTQAQIAELNSKGQLLVDEYKELLEQSKNTVPATGARTAAEQAAQRKLKEIQEKQKEVQDFRQNSEQSLEKPSSPTSSSL